MTAEPVRAYVNKGRWVADCPRPYCGGAELLHNADDWARCVACRERRDNRPVDPFTDEPWSDDDLRDWGKDHDRSVYFHCTNCKLIAPVEWPEDAAEITSVLDERPVPQTRDWFPADHPLALRANQPHGQSVADLRAEALEQGLV